MQSCPIGYFLTKHPLPLYFQMVAISQWMELGCWDWTQCLCFFQDLSESHLFCLIRYNRRLVLTYICNPVQFQIFLPNTPYPTIFKWMELGCWDWTQCFCFFKTFQNRTYFVLFVVTLIEEYLTEIFKECLEEYFTEDLWNIVQC